MTVEQRPLDPSPTLQESKDKNLSANSFVRFLDEKMDPVQTYIGLEQEMRRETKGWINSPQCEEVVQQAVGLVLQKYHIRPDRVSQYEATFRRYYLLVTFGSALGKKAERSFIKLGGIGLTNPVYDEDAMEVESKLKEFAVEYREAMEPLTKAQGAIADKLREDFRTHFSEGISRLADFAHFLNSPEFAQDRERFSLLLRGIALETVQNPSSDFLDVSVKEVKSKNAEKPDISLLKEFLIEKARRPHPVQSSWIKFTARDHDIDLEHGDLADLAAVFIDKLPLPQDLGAEYNAYFSNLINNYYLSIKRGLAPFMPKVERMTTDGLSLAPSRQGARLAKRNKTIKHDREVVEGTALYIDADPVQEEEPEEHEIGLIKPSTAGLSFDAFEADDLESFIAKTANKFAKNDQRMRKDIGSMIKFVRNQPVGPDVAVLPFARINMNSEELSLRRLQPRNRNDIKYEHELTPRLRLVFAMDKAGRIMIKDIYTHKAYEAEFAMRGG